MWSSWNSEFAEDFAIAVPTVGRVGKVLMINGQKLCCGIRRFHFGPSPGAAHPESGMKRRVIHGPAAWNRESANEVGAGVSGFMASISARLRASLAEQIQATESRFNPAL